MASQTFYSELRNRIKKFYSSDSGFGFSPSQQNQLAQWIETNHAKLFEEKDDWFAELLRDYSSHDIVGQVLAELSPATKSVLFTRDHIPITTILSGLHRSIFVTPNNFVMRFYLLLLSNLHCQGIVTVRQLYNAIWIMVKSAQDPAVATLGRLDQAPQPLFATDFPPHYDWFRFHLSRYFTISPCFDKADLTDVVNDIFPIASKPLSLDTTKAPTRHHSIPPFSIESCFKHTLMNSYEEHQYYLEQKSNPTSSASSTSPPPPSHISFPDYSSIPHPYFTINQTAMSDPDVIQAIDYQTYFVWMFLIGYPSLEAILTNNKLDLAVPREGSPPTNLSPANAPFAALWALIMDNFLNFQTSMALTYQVYLFNFRFHLIDLIVAKLLNLDTPPIKLILMVKAYAMKQEYALLDPLLYWSFAADPQHVNPDISSSSLNTDPTDLSNAAKLPHPDPKFKKICNAVCPSSIIKLITCLTRGTAVQHHHHRQVASPDLLHHTTIHKNTNITIPTSSSLHPLHLNIAAMLTQLFLHVNTTSPYSRYNFAPGWGSGSRFELCGSDSSRAFLRAFIIHSYNQLSNNIPTLYQYFFLQSLSAEDPHSYFQCFLLLAPLFAFRADVDDAADAEALRLVQMHITLAAHASFLNPSVTTEAIPRTCKHAPTNPRQNLNRVLIPIRSAIYTWLVIHSGLTQFFPTPPPNSPSHGNLFYSAMMSAKKWDSSPPHPGLNHEVPIDYSELLKPFIVATITTPFDNPLKSTSNESLMSNIEKIVLDNQGTIIHVKLRPNQSVFPAQFVSKDLGAESVWDNDSTVTVIDVNSPFFHTSLHAFIALHKHPLDEVNFSDPSSVPREVFDYNRWREQCNDQAYKHLSDDELYDVFTRNNDAPPVGFGFGVPAPAFGVPAPAFGVPAPAPAFGVPAPAFGVPAPAPAFGAPAPAFGAPAPAFVVPAPAFVVPAPAFGANRRNAPIFLPDYDHSIPHQFTKPQIDAVSSTANQCLLKSPPLISLQQQYRAYLKDLVGYESIVVSHVLKQVLGKAQCSGLLQTHSEPKDPLFRPYPFSSLPSSTKQDSTHGLSQLQEWCIEMLLVATLNIQPAFDPKIHTHFHAPQSPPTGPHNSDVHLKSCPSIISSHFLHPDRNWFTTLPHVELVADNFTSSSNRDYPWFMHDSHLEIVTRTVLATHSVLFKVEEDLLQNNFSPPRVETRE